MTNTQLNFKDIILKHKKSVVNSRSECDISVFFGNKKYSSPVCCSNMKSILTPNICKIFDDRKWFYVYHRIDGSVDVKNFVISANNRDGVYSHDWYSISISVGINDEWLLLIDWLSDNGYRIDAFTIDVALSYNDNIIPVIKKIKEKYPKSFLIVGNGCVSDWIIWLEDLGVDCAKIGIGVSRSCRTKQYTGFGSSTISSLLECASATNNIKLMNDGGLTVSDDGEIWIGDIAKSFVCGADYVMSGAVFASCLDSPSIIDGYFGNASEFAKQNRVHIEGAKIVVETNGLTINQMCDLIEDSLKSSISYSGGKDLSAFNFVDWDVIH